ncbi:hypothetical protein QMG90_03535 [Trabulsiella odontotermitis]|uniref:hypothetical protein n=1 Tax=Trabulsiella odontotermitis TaxID=379893 RepID=UPI0024B6AC0B|nr:hypothetical protein [Trabulsiella odontotermitis]WHP32025.1 hypothetical protein QMG90_03535 [Trabulsiella odontotermitis]
MHFRLTLFLCAAAFLSGCSYSPIDAKKTEAPRTGSHVSKTTTVQLTDRDVFGSEATLAVSEEDIQDALDGENFNIPLNASVILVQSGSRAPEMMMQQEMSKYYLISTFSGIPDLQKSLSCNKSAETAESENMNYMQALRYIAAKGRQKAVIVYWDELQSGKYDTVTKNTVWTGYKNEKLTDATLLRYLVRFALVDVATGEWASWSPVNYEYSVLSPTGATSELQEQQIAQLKQKTYAAVVKDLVSRYE